jgi:transcriptional regulator with XRE-family HTH domain
MEKIDQLPAIVGLRIAERRNALGFTLEGLAERSGVSRAMISRIERGEASAGAVVLARIAGGLNLSLSALFADAEPAPSPIARFADQPAWRDPQTGYMRRNVSPRGFRSRVEIVDVSFPAGQQVIFDSATQTSQEQHVWMLEGDMEISVGDAVHPLGAGDCLHIRLPETITYRNGSDKKARYAVVLIQEKS